MKQTRKKKKLPYSNFDLRAYVKWLSVMSCNIFLLHLFPNFFIQNWFSHFEEGESFEFAVSCCFKTSLFTSPSIPSFEPQQISPGLLPPVLSPSNPSSTQLAK